MSVLNSIAAEISPELPGIPWEDLEKKFGIPREEVVVHVGENTSPNVSGFFAYTEILRQTYGRMEEVLSKCILSFQVEDNPATSQNERVLAARALDSVEQGLSEVGDQILAALRANISVLADEDAVNLEQEKFRAVISVTQISCLYGLVTHVNGGMQLAKVAPEDIVNSADELCKTMNGVIQLWDVGALNSLKRDQLPPVVAQPVGAIPAAVIVIIVATIAAAILAWCVVSMTKQLEVNRQMKLICEDAVRRQDKHALEVCAELLKVNTVATGGEGGPMDWVAALGKAVLYVGIGYVLLKVAGPVSEMLSKKDRS